MNNIVRTRKQFLKVVKKMPRGSIIIFDEAGIIPDNSKYLDAINREVSKAFKALKVDRRKSLPI